MIFTRMHPPIIHWSCLWHYMLIVLPCLLRTGDVFSCGFVLLIKAARRNAMTRTLLIVIVLWEWLSTVFVKWTSIGPWANVEVSASQDKTYIIGNSEEEVVATSGVLVTELDKGSRPQRSDDHFELCLLCANLIRAIMIVIASRKDTCFPTLLRPLESVVSFHKLGRWCTPQNYHKSHSTVHPIVNLDEK